MRSAGLRIDHQLRVAVVCRDDHRAAFGADRLVDFSQAGVYGFDCLDGGLEFSAVAHHVRVGEIHDHHVKRTLVHRFDHRVLDPSGAHFGLQVIGGHLGRGHQDAVFSRVGLLNAAVEEVSHVGVLLRFRHAQVPEVQIGHYTSQDVPEFLGREDVRQSEGPVVPRHGNEVELFREIAARELVEPDLGERSGCLARAVGAEIVEHHGIARADLSRGLASLVSDDDGQDEFIRDALVVRILDRGDGVARLASLAVDHRVVGLLDAVPAVVAVHGVVAPADRRDLAHAVVAHFLLERRQVFDAFGRRCVAPVEKNVHEHVANAVLPGHAEQRVKVFLVRMDAAVA